MKSVAVHDGMFHADDVFAVAILRLINPKIKVIRTRKPSEIEKVDFRVDVGRKYSPKKGDFDHHQEEFTKKRPNGVPYASVGLIWKHFGKRLVKSGEGFNYIDETLIQPIDSEDNGMQVYSANTIQPYTMKNVIDSFRPNGQDGNIDFDKSFEGAVWFAQHLLKREIVLAKIIKKANGIVKKAISKANGIGYLVLGPFVPWKKLVIKKSKAKFVVYTSKDNQWCAEAVPLKNYGFARRKVFPKKWADKLGKELAQVTGVKDATFCHKHRFIACAKSKEGAIKLAKLALKK